MGVYLVRDLAKRDSAELQTPDQIVFHSETLELFLLLDRKVFYSEELNLLQIE